MFSRVVSALATYDSLPLLHDGKCQHCGHEHGSTFGRITCDSCGKIVHDNDMARRRSLMTGRDWLRVTILGILAGLLLAGGAVFFDLTKGELARVWHMVGLP